MRNLKSNSLFFCSFIFFSLQLFPASKDVTEFSFMLKPSNLPEAGIGVFATHDIKAGTKLLKATELKISKYETIPEPFLGFVDTVSSSDDYCIRPQNFDRMELFFYVNHSFTPNLFLADSNTYVALRNIQMGEELFIDYSLLGDPEGPEDAYFTKPTE